MLYKAVYLQLRCDIIKNHKFQLVIYTVQGFSEAQFGASKQPLSQSRNQVNFPNFQLKKSPKMEENPNFMFAETYDKIVMQ